MPTHRPTPSPRLLVLMMPPLLCWLPQPTVSIVQVPRKLSLEEAMGWMQPGELLEVTPSAFRLRHEILHTPERERVVRRAAKERRNNS
jgi:hypothetical protein